MGTCCALKWDEVEHDLNALGEGDFVHRMYRDMAAEEARVFADELCTAAARLEQQHSNNISKSQGAGYNGHYDKKKRATLWTNYTAFEQALASVREAARWYEKVAKLGYGVHATQL